MISVDNINNWEEIIPDKDDCWVDCPNPKTKKNFKMLINMGNKKIKKEENKKVMFNDYSNGVATNRDAWVYNSSKSKLFKNVNQMIDYCNKHHENFVVDPKQAKWTRGSAQKYKQLGKQVFDETKIITSLYRPFFKQYLYFDKTFNENSPISKFYPHSKVNIEGIGGGGVQSKVTPLQNLSIMVPDKTKGEFSVLMTNTIPDLQVVFNNQCFAMKVMKP